MVVGGCLKEGVNGGAEKALMVILDEGRDR